MRLNILENGSRETLKGAIHGVALGLSALIGLYNIAAWLQRREVHLGVNSIVYIALVWFETQHVRHHFESLARDAASATLVAAAAVAAAVEDGAPEKRAA